MWEKSNGRINYPNFGKCISRNYFKAFLSASPYCFADKSSGMLTKETNHGTCFPLALENSMQKKAINQILAWLDESISEWRPETSKLSGLPSWTFEPMKLESLGTVLKNIAEIKSDLITYDDVAQNSEQQWRKKHSKEKSCLPDNFSILAHASEALRKASGMSVKNKVRQVEIFGLVDHLPEQKQTNTWMGI